jgi:predicted HTH transcriptional regulator
MGIVNLNYRDCKLMEMHYPVGSQYADLIGSGALVGFADEILKATAQFRAKRDATLAVIAAKTIALREYKRVSRAKPVKRETLAMKAIERYIKRKPGATRGEIIIKGLDKFDIAASTVGYSIKALVDQGRIRYIGPTGYRKYFIVEAKP